MAAGRFAGLRQALTKQRSLPRFGATGSRMQPKPKMQGGAKPLMLKPAKPRAFDNQARAQFENMGMAPRKLAPAPRKTFRTNMATAGRLRGRRP